MGIDEPATAGASVPEPVGRGSTRAVGRAGAYAWFCGVFLLVQGASTLVARLWPAADRAVPWLLAATHMQPLHSLLHVATATLALLALASGRTACRRFAVGFGVFYAGLGLIGMASGHSLGLHLQPFDHPFHLLLGGLGLIAAWLDRGAG